MKKIQHNNSNDESYIKINLINVQGLTQTKAIELENMLRQNEIICLTETQQKIEKTRFKNSTGSIVTMRRKEEKKGGGLMIMYKKKHVTFEQYVTRNNNLMHASCKIGSEKFNIILVYMSVDNIVQNKNNMKEIESIINDIQGSYMILGDFNGHLGFLGPHQMNKNGELLYNLIDKHNLILLNGHPECTGEITWEQKNKRSVIDYILVNKDMHESFISMNIDESKEVFDLSDHNIPANNETKLCLRCMPVICRHCRQRISVKNMPQNC